MRQKKMHVDSAAQLIAMASSGLLAMVSVCVTSGAPCSRIPYFLMIALGILRITLGITQVLASIFVHGDSLGFFGGGRVPGSLMDDILSQVEQRLPWTMLLRILVLI